MQLTILEDVAQKVGKHSSKNEYWKKNGVGVVRLPLPVGDYILMNDDILRMLSTKRPDFSDVSKKDFYGLHDRSVDTKFSLSEVYSCIIQDHARFAREADRAKEFGIDLTILVEEPGVHRISDVQWWNNPHYFFSMQRYKRAMQVQKNGKWKTKKRIMPPVTSEGLMNRMIAFAEHHGCKWEFCDPKDAGEKVIEILTRGN